MFIQICFAFISSMIWRGILRTAALHPPFPGCRSGQAKRTTQGRLQQQAGKEKLRLTDKVRSHLASFSRMNCRPARRNWAVQPENGQPDMASHCSGSSSDWPTMLICFFGVTGWSEPWRTDA